MLRKSHCAVLPIFLIGYTLCTAAADHSFQYTRIGESRDAKATPAPGVAMMGGGGDLDTAFRWLCEKANGGDFLVLRARGGDDYNPYINGLCKLNSVATLIIPDRVAAQDPRVAEIIHKAQAIFIAGGDQARYVNFWKGTTVQDAIDAGVVEGKPIGGTSAGLAVLGEFAYGALGDQPDDKNLASTDVLRDPFVNRVTLIRDFLRVPLLENTITDSHFAKRDRMGRSLGFLARIVRDGWSKNARVIAIDEGSAVLVESSGRAEVVGAGNGAYFIRPTKAPAVCEKKMPLTFREVSVCRVPSGGQFDLASWTGNSCVSYLLSVERGVIRSTQHGHGIY